jgi:hypothetical protein
MEHLPLATTIIVRVTEKDGGRLTGTVERARTGERRPFLGVEHIGEVIAEMAAATPPPDATVTEPSGPAKEMGKGSER